jgi:negative regulator of sigma E activity
MSDILNEQLSALIDGELPPEETTLLLKRLEREPELAARLVRYRQYGEALRGEQPAGTRDFGERIRQRIAEEPVHEATAPSVPTTRADGWRSAFGGLAVAAAVATLALLGIHQLPLWSTGESAARGVPAPAPAAALAQASPTNAPQAHETASAVVDREEGTHEAESYVTPASPSTLQVMPQAELARYVVAHSEVSMPLSSRDVLIHLIADAPDEAASQP